MSKNKSLAWYTSEPVSMKFKAKRRAIGDLGEEIACIYFHKIGWRILEKNWKLHRASELDFILLLPCNTMVFLEVKTRSFGESTYQNFQSCFETLNLKKQRNIIQAAKIFARRKSQFLNMRFDVLAISILSYSIDHTAQGQRICVNPENVKFLHVESAFSPDH